MYLIVVNNRYFPYNRYMLVIEIDLFMIFIISIIDKFILDSLGMNGNIAFVIGYMSICIFVFLVFYHFVERKELDEEEKRNGIRE